MKGIIKSRRIEGNYILTHSHIVSQSNAEGLVQRQRYCVAIEELCLGACCVSMRCTGLTIHLHREVLVVLILMKLEGIFDENSFRSAERHKPSELGLKFFLFGQF